MDPRVMDGILRDFSGQPATKVTWYRDGASLRTKVQNLANGKIRTEIEFPNLRRHDLDSKIKCEAKNNDMRPPKTSQVTIDMYRE